MKASARNSARNGLNTWEWVRLSDVCKLVGQAVNPQEHAEEIFAHYSIPAFDGGCSPVMEAGATILSNKIAFPKGAVLFSKLNPRIPRVWHVTDDHNRRRISSTEFLPLLIDQGRLDPEFLALALQAPNVLNGFRGKVSAGTNSRQRLKPEHLLRAYVPYGPLASQTRTAQQLREQLAAVRTARTAIGQQIQTANALQAALLRVQFSSASSRHWTTTRLGDVAEIVGGMQKTPDRAPRSFHKPFLTVRNVQHGRLDLSDVQQFEVTPVEFERLRLLRGDLLLVEGNGSRDHIGRNALFEEEGDWIHQNHIIRVRLSREHLVPEFVAFYLNSTPGRAQLLEKAETTTGLYTLSTGKIASLIVPRPSRSVQSVLVSTLTSQFAEANALHHHLTQRLAATEQAPSALLRHAFNGHP